MDGREYTRARRARDGDDGDDGDEGDDGVRRKYLLPDASSRPPTDHRARARATDVFVCDGMRLQVRIVSIIKSMYGEKNCENMSSHRRVARESVSVVLAFSLIFFEWCVFFSREGLGYMSIVICT